MIREIKDSNFARDFLNSVPFDEYVPEGFPVCNEKTIVLGVFDPDLVCCFPCQKYENEIEIHAACLPKYRGKKAVYAAQKAFAWIFENTDFETIYSEISQKHVAVYAEWCGMKRVGNRFEVKRWASL